MVVHRPTQAMLSRFGLNPALHVSTTHSEEYVSAFATLQAEWNDTCGC